MEERIVIPFAPILVESTRSIGYLFEAAVADIVDNSISAGATEVRIGFMSKEPRWLCIEDNGCGMAADEIENAMRYGSQDPHDTRDKNDLGRFGLGLKMASLSQCRKLTVMSKKDGKTVAASWDLDYIKLKKSWALKVYSESEMEDLPGFFYLNGLEHGTVVLWQDFDRLEDASANAQKSFDEKIELTRKHLSLVFHRFLGDENPKKRLALYFNGDPVQPMDPFLTRHPSTQPLSEQILRINNEEVRVKPYVLPYPSKLSASDIESMGGKDELRLKQGFYIYRNKRLIVWGTWFRLIRQNELGKLARVRVDIPNSLDSMWEIDIKKSTATLPDCIKKNLAAVVKNAVGRSERVYKYRGRNVQTDDLVHAWNPVDFRGTFQYQINRDLPLLKMLENHLDEDGLALFDNFLKMLEDTFPYADVYYRLASNEANVTEKALETDEARQIALQMVHQAQETGGNVPQLLSVMDKMDFFVKYPDVLKELREEYCHD